MAWWIWIIAGALLLGAEVIITADFFLVFFGLSAMVVGLLALAGVVLPIWAQALLFASLAVVGLVVYRGRLKRRLEKADSPMGPELVGERGSAREDIGPGARGRIFLRGVAWTARNDGPIAIPAGGSCVVVGVDGVTLHVRADI